MQDGLLSETDDDLIALQLTSGNDLNNIIGLKRDHTDDSVVHGIVFMQEPYALIYLKVDLLDQWAYYIVFDYVVFALDSIFIGDEFDSSA